MALKTFNPITPSNRYKEWPDYSSLDKRKPEKSLLFTKKKTGGRNNTGVITVRHIGGGHKQKIRMVDFKRTKRDQPATVVSVEYDPNRSSRIALLEYKDGTKAYIIAPDGLVAGRTVNAGEKAAPEIGNALPLSAIPLGTAIHCVELKPGQGGRVARSAGQSVMLNNREGEYALIKMPSGEIRKVHVACYATVGVVGNSEHMNVVSGKAGRTRWRGIRPTVRGMTMNPVDHPNGGGEGRSKSGGGRQHLLSPWGHAKGQKTRKKYHQTDRFIIQRRNAKKAS